MSELLNNIIDLYYASKPRIIDLYSASKPRIIWEIDENILKEIKHIKDATGTYIWLPVPNYPDMGGTLLGLQIAVSKEKCFQLKYIFPNGNTEIFKMDSNQIEKPDYSNDDQIFLLWIYDRLCNKHNENKNFDYMRRLEKIAIQRTPVQGEEPKELPKAYKFYSCNGISRTDICDNEITQKEFAESKQDDLCSKCENCFIINFSGFNE